MTLGKMYHIEAMEEVIETVLYTSCINQEIPVSIIIVGPSGVGKSKMLARYQSEALKPTDSISSKGLYDIAVADAKKEVRFLLIPDMNPTLSRKQSTVEATVANLLSFTSDGTVRVDDGRSNKECKHDPVGIITASTDDIYNKQAKKWFALGLRRRIIPIFFKYTRETLDKLQNLVMEEKIHSTNPVIVPINLKKKVRPAIPQDVAFQIKSLSIVFSMHLGKTQTAKNKEWYVRDVIPISPQVILSTLARAHALRDNRPAVTMKDYEFLCRFLDFCDPEHPKEI